MKMYIQWITDPAEGWIEYDSSEWISSPKKDCPSSERIPIFDLDAEPDPDNLTQYKVVDFKAQGNIIDTNRGWIKSFNIFGVGFFGDHYAVVEEKDYVIGYAWYNDPRDFDPSKFRAQERHFYPDGKQRVIEYCGPVMAKMYKNCVDDFGPLVIHPWKDFVQPEDSLVRHGIWASDILIKQLDAYSRPSRKDWFK